MSRGAAFSPITLASPVLGVRAQRRRRSLGANVAWTFGGNALFAGSQWLIIVAIARLGNATMLGAYALAVAVSAPVIIFANLKLRAVQATDAAEEYRFADYLGLRLITSSLALGVIGALAVAGPFDGTSRGVLLIVGVMRFIDAISDIFYGLFQRHERLDMAGVSLTLRALSSLALFTAALAATGELVPALAASSCAWLAVLLGHDAPRARRLLARDLDSAAASGRARWAALRPTWDLSRHARLALFALPLGINVLLDTLWTNFPRYVLERTDGTIALGVFAALGAIMASSSLVITALGQSISPRLARYRAAGQRGAFVRLLLVAIALGGSLGVIGFIVAASLGSEILSALYGAEYARYSPALTWMMAAIAMQNAYMFCGTATTVLRRFWVQFAIQVASFALMVPLSLHLIQREGVTGASKSLFYTNLLEAVVYTIVVVTLLRDFSRRSPSAYGYITMASAGKTRALNNE